MIFNRTKNYTFPFFQLYIHSSVEELFEFFLRSMLPVQYGGTLTDYYMSYWLRKAKDEHAHFPAGGQKNIF